MLEIKEIWKTFNAGTVNEKQALRGVSLTLKDGDFCTVIGGNGAGKSTMLNAVAGTFTVDSGAIVIDGVDVSYYQFSPMFVNESRYRGEDYRDIPLLTDREVWLKKSVLDENGQPVLDEHGKPEKDVVRVMPAQIKEALDRSRSEYLQSLAEKARGAREGSERLGNAADRGAQSRESIAM